MGEKSGTATREVRGFAARLREMSEEEKKAWYAQRREKIKAVHANRRQEVKDWKQEQVRMLANMVREDTLNLDDPQYQPTELTLWKIHSFLNQGFTILDIRDGLLEQGICTEMGWNKLKKLLFEKNLSRIEDLGFDIFASQRRSLELIDQEIKTLQKMKRAKPYEVNISKAIIDAAEKRHRIQGEMTKLFIAGGIVGDKKRGGNTINFFSGVPRPKREEKLVEEAVEVTPQRLPRPE
jgi:hypothetical protein